MPELRWILLAAGLALIAGLYAWGVRSRGRSAASEPTRATRIEPARSAPAASVAARVEPPVWAEEPVVAEDDDLPSLEIEAGDEAHPDATESTLPPATEERRPPPQKIVAVRVAATEPAAFAGTTLRAAIDAEGFEFGRYEIFHRLDPSGRPLCSLASLREPGTFDLEAMPTTDYRGVALFSVLPGPLPGHAALDELITTARALAERLGGVLQDDRGAPLSLQRVAHLRDEVAEFERVRARASGR
jgi:cell division protein ZipA